jgi:ArsR family transcriptional regulator
MRTLVYAFHAESDWTPVVAAYLKAVFGPRVDIRSDMGPCGSEVEQLVRVAMAEDGVILEHGLPLPLTHEAARAADRVVSIGRPPIGDTRLPRVDDWALPACEGLDLPGVRKVRDRIKTRVFALAGAIQRGDVGAPSGMLYADELLR